MNKSIIYLDMDQVLVNFNSSSRIPKNEKHLYNHPEIFKKGFFLELTPMVGAIDFVNYLLDLDKYDVYILTQPVAKSYFSYSEKVQWIEEYIPRLLDKIIMTQNKLLLKGDLLVDDNEKWKDFDGKFFLFEPLFPESEFEILKAFIKENL